MKPTITTHSGLTLDFVDPKFDQIHIQDIAAGLARECRFIGQLKDPDDFYSVAEHCLAISYYVPPEFALEALLHDASEAYMADLSTPLKMLLPEYKAIERRLQGVINHKYLGHSGNSNVVKNADYELLCFEQRALMHGPYLAGEDCPGLMLRLDKPRERFLQRFEELYNV